MFFIPPTLGLLALALIGCGARRHPARQAGFARRYVTMLAFGPFVVTLRALVLGRLAGPDVGLSALVVRTACGLALVRAGHRAAATDASRPASSSSSPRSRSPMRSSKGSSPHIRDRPKATQFPGRGARRTVTQRWRDKFGTPLALCGRWRVRHQQHRGLFARPAARHRACRSGRQSLIDLADLKRRGAVLVWETGRSTRRSLHGCARTIPGWRCANRSRYRARCSSRAATCARFACTWRSCRRGRSACPACRRGRDACPTKSSAST